MTHNRVERHAALERLRKNRGQPGQSSSSAKRDSSTVSLSDETTSRFFGSATSSLLNPTGRVLVPSSSPIHPPASSYKPNASRNMPLVPPAFAKRTSDDDGLSAPSGFTSRASSTSSLNGLGRPQLPVPPNSRRRPTLADSDHERPRKRHNKDDEITPAYGGSSNTSTPPHVADPRDRTLLTSCPPLSSTSSAEHSPQVKEARRQFSTIRLDSANHTENDEDKDDDVSDIRNVDRPRKRRLVRGTGRSTSPPVISLSSPTLSPLRPSFSTTFDRLATICSFASAERVKAVLQEEQGDIERATNRLLDEHDRLQGKSGHTHLSVSLARGPVQSHSSTISGPIYHKGNRKSAIYARRGTVDQKHSQTNPVKDVKRKRSDSESSSMPSDTSPSLVRKGKKRSLSDPPTSSESEDVDGDDLEARRVEGVSWFNDATAEQLIEVTSCTAAQAQTIISLRPFEDHEQLRSKLNKRKGVSYKLFELYISVMQGYGSLDVLLKKCQKMGDEIALVINKWGGGAPFPERPGLTNPPLLEEEDAGVHLTQINVELSSSSDDPDLKLYLRAQPELLSDTVLLKDYQLLGVNWLNLLWSKRMSCILADEMGLGKTVQVIAFLSYIKSSHQHQGFHHLIIVPASTLENWVREFERFSPSISVQTYYGSQPERSEIRRYLLASQDWDVLVTTYNLAQGSDLDRQFFRRINWEVCVFDEGHVLKNFQSQRYTHLMKIRAHWRLLLTGTPLQNNLQELVSLLNFIMPSLFTQHEETLRAIFKARADSHLSFLSRERISRAKKMMAPFVLRRKKDQVLKDLPKKTERVEFCDMTPLQRTIYREALQRSRKTIQAVPEDALPAIEVKTKGKRKSKIGATTGDTSSNVLMDLRKASSHPMLFRRLFDDQKIRVMARHCMKEPEFCGSNYQYVVEDMEVMTDAELQKFCKRYKSVNRHALKDDCFLDGGKIQVLLKILNECMAEAKRVLIFSQFTQILDILEVVLTHLHIRYLLLTGTTPVDERQGLVDEFNGDEGIPVFLLSTRAGGMGINLTAACVVVIFDQDFNPHNDKQACDRAYRIGQKRDVEVVKLITRNTIEEDIHRLGNTKLMLDDAVAADREDEGESAPEKAMKESLLSILRRQFENEEQHGKEAEAGASA